MVKKIQLAANLLFIATATLLGVVLVKHYLLPKPQPTSDAAVVTANDSTRKHPAIEQIQPGTKLSIAGIDWAKNGRTLLIAVSDKCHFCSESAPFYRRLVQDRGATRLVAVLPQAVEDGKRYLAGLNVAIDDIRQAPLTSVGIKATPTLILIDGNGVTINSWIGKLPASQEAVVLGSLQGAVARN
jgi:hypothetical protein